MLDKLPDASFLTIPAVVKPSIVMVPVGPIFIASAPFVSNERVFAVPAEIPVLVLPVNWSDGDAAEPAGSCKVPVMVPPLIGTNDPPVTPTVIDPAPLVTVTFEPAVIVER